MDADPPVPPVVAVVIATGPETGVATALRALGGQGYPNLSVLVIDAAGGADPTPEVADALPDAFVRRIEGGAGWAAAANEVLGVVEGASHYLFCHDDAAPEPDALQAMVEEAFRSNAAVVGSKLVEWDAPGILQSVGLGADRLGALHAVVEPGELDQEQHDAVRDVFAVPGAAMLVRADLFGALGGFDPALDGAAAELDLCWRVQLAGGRIVVAPAARVRHRSSARPDLPAAEGGPRPADEQRLRTVLVCAGVPTLIWLLPLSVALLALEALGSLVAGRPADAGRRARTLVAPLGDLGGILRARRRAQRARQVPDRRIRRLQTRGNTRLRSWARRHLDDAPEVVAPDPAVPAPQAGAVPAGSPGGSWRLALGAAAVLLAVFVIGSRSLVGGVLPDVASIPDTSGGIGAFLHSWLSTWQGAVLGRSGPATPALGLLALAGLVLGGAVGTLQHIVVLGPLVVGPVGAWRAARPWGSARGRVAALVAYAVAPVGLDALALGHWDGLLAYAAAPWALAGLVRLSDALPMPGLAGRPVLGRVVGVGLLTAVVAAFVPSWLLVVPVTGAALAVGSLLIGQSPVAARLVATAIAAAVLAGVLLLPWSLRVLTDPTTMFGPGHPASDGRSFATLLHLSTGPAGPAALGWGLVIAAVLPLVIGRSWRLAWAARLWVLALVGVLWSWAGLRGWVPMADPEVVLAPTAAAFAACIALGVVAFELDLPGYRFGWRQLASALAAVGLTLAAVPVLASAGGGRWGLPSAGPSSVLASLQYDGGGDYRILWAGAPDALPLASRALGRGQAFATSFDGLPGVTDAWGSGRPGGSELLAGDLRLTEGGLTTKLGHLLAPFGIRYLVLPSADGPSGTGARAEPTSAALERGLLLQTDLRQLTLDPSYTVYENQAWVPVRAAVPVAAGGALHATGPAAARLLSGTGLTASGAVLASGSADRASGPVQAGTDVYVAATPDPAWHLDVAGRAQSSTPVLGTGRLYRVGTAGRASLVVGVSAFWRIVQWLAVLAWVAAVVVVTLDRRRRAARPDDPVRPEWFTPLSPSRHQRSRRTRAASTAPRGMGTEEVWIDA